MGKKDSKMTPAAAAAAEDLRLRLSNLGDIRTRKMFGGFGVFEQDTMFALVDSEGIIFFKVDASNIHLYEAAGSNKHSRMPYYRVPEEVLDNEETLQEWANTSMLVARSAK